MVVRTRRRQAMTARIVVTLLALCTLGTSEASAEEPPQGCPPRAAVDASAEEPHVVDPQGDVALAADMPSLDLRAVWVSQRSAPPWLEFWDHLWVLGGDTGFRVGLTDTSFRANIALSSLDEPLPTSTWRVVADTSDGRRFVGAEFSPSGRWVFHHGRVEGSDAEPKYVHDGPTTGAVDVDNGLISIDWVGEFQLKPPPGTGSSLRVVSVDAGLVVGSQFEFNFMPLAVPRKGVGLVTLDDATNAAATCDAILWRPE